ncbi:MAG TPA: hypothetical protein VFG29_13900 [Syntrophales bacterium]|nr:hypothetical protein [Syntrophales bacterium]
MTRIKRLGVSVSPDFRHPFHAGSDLPPIKGDGAQWKVPQTKNPDALESGQVRENAALNIYEEV